MGSHVAPHCARTNHRLTVHLGVRVPSADTGKGEVKWWLPKDDAVRDELVPLCGIRVGAECKSWEEGRVLVFDDSYEHEVWNDTKDTRVVLLIRFWHPSLRSE